MLVGKRGLAVRALVGPHALMHCAAMDGKGVGRAHQLAAVAACPAPPMPLLVPATSRLSLHDDVAVLTVVSIWERRSRGSRAACLAMGQQYRPLGKDVRAVVTDVHLGLVFPSAVSPQ